MHARESVLNPTIRGGKASLRILTARSSQVSRPILQDGMLGDKFPLPESRSLAELFDIVIFPAISPNTSR